MRAFNWFLAAALLAGLEPPRMAAQPQGVIVVSTAADLQATLTPGNTGRRIRVLSGTYPVGGPLVVPDGVTLEGEGVMTGTEVPDGFEIGTETRIVPDPAALPFGGDLLTLGHGVTIRGLIIEDVAGRPGNVVAVRSRAPGDWVSASIQRCEIVNPKPSGAGPDGPLGRALVVLTQNRLFAADPPPDEDAMVRVLLTHSIVRSTGGGSAIFANNFAARGDVTVVARSNRIFGSLEVDGGVSRPDEVKGARLAVESDGNVYSPLVFTPVAWTIHGGSGVPLPAFEAPGTSGNVVRFTSMRDVISGFPTGIAATGGRRRSLTLGPNSDNVVDLRLIGLQISTSTADLVLYGAAAAGHFAPGDGNIVRALMIGVTGSGTRLNSYENETGAGQPQSLGTGNELRILGSPSSFGVLNPGIDPAPATEFFIGLDR
jgi:hypothetical protein